MAAADRDVEHPTSLASQRSARKLPKSPRVPVAPLEDFTNPLAQTRAMAAFDDVCFRFALILEGISRDLSMTREQRAAAIQMARRQQRFEATEARRKVQDEERAYAEARRRVWQAQHSKPKGP